MLDGKVEDVSGTLQLANHPLTITDKAKLRLVYYSILNLLNHVRDGSFFSFVNNDCVRVILQFYS